MQRGAHRHTLQTLLQRVRRLLVAALRAQHVCRIDVGRHEFRIELDCRSELGMGSVSLSQCCPEAPERDAGLGPVCVVLQGRNVLLRRSLPARQQFLRQSVLAPRERSRRLDADGARRITEQRPEDRRACFGGHHVSQLHRRQPHQRACVLRHALHEVARELTAARQPRERRGTHDGRLRRVCGDAGELLQRGRFATFGSMKSGREGLVARRVTAEPVMHRASGPLRIAVGVARVTRIRHPESHALIGPRHAHAVIAPRIDDHVRVLWHVAVRRTVRLSCPARGGGAQPRRTARHRGTARRPRCPGARSFCVCGSWQSLQVTPALVHAALQPRAPDEHLVLLLAIDVVKRRSQQRRQVVIHERTPGFVPFGDLCATRMALRADCRFRARSCAACCVPAGPLPHCVPRSRRAARRAARSGPCLRPCPCALPIRCAQSQVRGTPRNPPRSRRRSS